MIEKRKTMHMETSRLVTAGLSGRKSLDLLLQLVQGLIYEQLSRSYIASTIIT